MGCIYYFYNRITKKGYVGQYKKNIPNGEWNRYCNEAKRTNNPNRALIRAIKKHGPEAFDISVLCLCETQEELDKMEDEWITIKQSMIDENGYNMIRGGRRRCPNFKHPEEHKKRMSEIMKRPKSEETKKKLSIAKKDKPASEANKNGIASSAQKKFNEEIFPKRLAEWIIEFNKKGSLPDPNSNDNLERKAGNWRLEMLRKYENSRSRVGLNDDQIKKLNETIGWEWRKNEDEFLVQLEKYKEAIAKYQNQSLRDKEDVKSSFNWQNRMRELFKKNDAYLTEERKNLLNNLEGWSWTTTFWNDFTTSFNKWKEFVMNNNRLPSMSANASDDEKKLARWQCKTRMDYSNKEKRLTEQKIKDLESHPQWKWIG